MTNNYWNDRGATKHSLADKPFLATKNGSFDGWQTVTTPSRWCESLDDLCTRLLQLFVKLKRVLVSFVPIQGSVRNRPSPDTRCAGEGKPCDSNHASVYWMPLSGKGARCHRQWAWQSWMQQRWSKSSTHGLASTQPRQMQPWRKRSRLDITRFN